MDREHARTVRRALAILHARGEHYCGACLDAYWRPAPGGYVPCGELHREMPPGDAREVIEEHRAGY